MTIATSYYQGPTLQKKEPDCQSVLNYKNLICSDMKDIWSKKRVQKVKDDFSVPDLYGYTWAVNSFTYLVISALPGMDSICTYQSWVRTEHGSETELTSSFFLGGLLCELCHAVCLHPFVVCLDFGRRFCRWKNRKKIRTVRTKKLGGECHLEQGWGESVWWQCSVQAGASSESVQGGTYPVLTA